MQSFLPWQASQWLRLQEARASDRFPHALLLSGPEHTGKRQFADALGQSLLCQSPLAHHLACADCTSCKLLAAGNHSDMVSLEPEEEGKAIKIDAMREFITAERLSSQCGGYKIRIIDPADAMNTATANALLKTLEEPSENSILLLISSRPGMLPGTIRSRCQNLTFPLPPRKQSLDWLNDQHTANWEVLLSVSAGAPFKALELARQGVFEARAQMVEELFALLDGRTDAVTLAAAWAGRDAAQLLHWLASILLDIIRLGVKPDLVSPFNPDIQTRLADLATQKNAKTWHHIMRKVMDTRKSLTRQLNLQLQLEALLISLADESASVQGGRNQ
jgi:DNA polymerase-3 subunit delta'